MSVCFLFGRFCCGTPLQRGTQTRPPGEPVGPVGLSSGPLVGVCLSSSASSPSNPLTPRHRRRPRHPQPPTHKHPACFVNPKPCVSSERGPRVPHHSLLPPPHPPSSRTHCSEWKVNRATASSAGPSFVWPAQIKCCAAPAADRSLFLALPVPALADLVSSIWMLLSAGPSSSPQRPHQCQRMEKLSGLLR